MASGEPPSGTEKKSSDGTGVRAVDVKMDGNGSGCSRIQRVVKGPSRETADPENKNSKIKIIGIFQFEEDGVPSQP